MDNNFIEKQANQFAKIVHHGTSKYSELVVLQERLDKELSPYLLESKFQFINFFEKELNRLFEEHLSTCQDFDGCSQHKTSRNAIFLIHQFKTQYMNNKKEKLAVKEDLNDSKQKFDLNYYFNASNIPNQDLVHDTYDYFYEGEGRTFFKPLDFLNLLNDVYQCVVSNVDKPFDILKYIKDKKLNFDRNHLILAFILKWFGGYPVQNLNSQYRTSLKLIEKEYKKSLQLDNPYTNDTFKKRLDKTIRNSETIGKSSRDEQLNNPIKVLEVYSENKDSVKDMHIFISHSHKDEKLVKAFVDKLLQLVLKIELTNIFCTSIEACSITSGEDFRNAIKEKLLKSNFVVQIITDNYRKSEVCLNEMGAAWVLSSKVKPFILPPVEYQSVGFIHHPNQLLKLDEKKDIIKFIEEIKPRNIDLNLNEVNRQVEEFLSVVKENFMSDNKSAETKRNLDSTKSLLSKEALELLSEGAKDKSNRIWKHPERQSPIKTNQKEFGSPKDKRTLAEYYSGLDELIEGKYVKELSGECVELTAKGYKEADTMNNNQ